MLKGLNIIRDATNMYLRLNDMVRGEYTGRVVYKRNEIIESTDTHEKRLKVIYSWLTKNQRRVIDYSDEFYDKVSSVLTGYHGERISWKRTLAIALDLASNLKFEIVNFFPELVEKALFSLDHILSDRYLVRTYIRQPEGTRLSKSGQAIRKTYGSLVQASDELRQALKFRKKTAEETEAKQPIRIKKEVPQHE